MKLLPIFFSLASAAFELVSLPSIDFSDSGGSIGLLGRFDALSFYSYQNASSWLLDSSNEASVYLRNTSNNANIKLGSIDGGRVTQILPLGDDSVIITGTFTSFNNESYTPPIIYNLTTDEVTSIFSTSNKKRDSSDGSVKVAFVDNNLIYLGGDFEYNSTWGAAVYNISSEELLLLPFKGFGNDSVINSITKLIGDSDNEGSIIFGGSFNTLGLPELLSLNISSNSSLYNTSNSTNVSLISAEQKISLKHGDFTSINSDSDASSIICPTSNNTWVVDSESGGQWAVELPSAMYGVKPTKVRLYLPEDSTNGIKTFRIYTYPNNGIMNLTYVDPETNDLSYCAANCPLPKYSELLLLVDANKDNGDDMMDEDDTIFVNEDGSFAMYYDSSTKSKNLGYGNNYMEFALVNEIAIDKVGLTVIDWYGDHAELAGFELYTNAINVYGNETLNESNCGSEALISQNSAVLEGDGWQSVQNLVDSITDTDYIVYEGASEGVGVTLYPNISYDGYYSLLLYTPGCNADDSCDKRSIVNVSVIDTELNVLETKLIYQNNAADKFDYLYYGHMNGSSSDNGQNKITIEFYRAVDLSVTDAWMVVDHAVANIVSLDTYSTNSLSNSTSSSKNSSSELEYIYLNGLFEYSLANFSLFLEDLVYTESGGKTIIKSTNRFVGNSSINELSGKLSDNSTFDQLLLQNSSDSSDLLLLGDFSSSVMDLSNNNLLTLTIEGYNSTLNLSEVSTIQKRFVKREEIDEADFNSSITRIDNVDDGFIALGAFSATVDGDEEFKNLDDGNSSTSSANNFAFRSGSEWYSFGNSFIDADFNSFVQLTIDNSTYFVFAADDEEYQVWDQLSTEFVNKSNLHVSTVATVSLKAQQVLGGSSFNIMDYYGTNQGYLTDNLDITSYSINITSGEVLTSFHANSSFSVFGGRFDVNGTRKNIAFISGSTVTTLNDTTWDDDTLVGHIYVDTDSDYMFFGTNGSVLTGNGNVTGLVILHSSNKSFVSTQPADLSTNLGDLLVNAMALYNEDEKLLVGGRFDNAGSLSCEAICIYDITNTRWESPSSNSIGGTVTDAKFIDSDTVLLSGNITLNDTVLSFAVYEFSTSLFTAASTQLDNIGESDDYIRKFTINEETSQKLSSRMTAFGSSFVKAFNGSQWTDISDGIDISPQTEFTDMKLLLLTSKNKSRSLEYFDNDQILLLSGVFNLTDYGLVNAAFFDGDSWTPYIYSLYDTESPGLISLLLVADLYSYQSSKDLESSSSHLSKGQVVGISLACAIGSTALIGLLYLIPMLYLFKKSDNEERASQRIHEDEMMNVVDPEELFHEIDLQRNT